MDVSSTRKRGTAKLDFGKKLPFDVTLTYMRELKSGYRGKTAAVSTAPSTAWSRCPAR